MINIWIKANCFNFSMPKNISASNSLAIQVKVYYNTINTTNHKKKPPWLLQMKKWSNSNLTISL